MLLSIEVSLYCPRFVVMAVKDGKPRIIYTAVNDHQREASMALRRRTPHGKLLLEIADKLAFVLAAYPITDAVWSVRPLAAINREAAKCALGAILLTLAQHGVNADEMQRSRMLLLLTGRSNADAQTLHEYSRSHFDFPEDIPEYMIAALIGAAWFKQQHLLS